MSRIARTNLPLSYITALAIAGSIILAPMAYAKHAAFELPACDKLLEGDGPGAVHPQASSAKSSSKHGSKSLAPMKLTSDQDSFIMGPDGKVRMEVQENVSVQPGQPTTEDPTASKSVVGNDDKLKRKLLKESQAVNVAPIALQESESEAQQKADTIGDSERAQLTDLWTSTINKSPDIQFVINRLQPTTDQTHVTAKAIQLIGGALFQAVQMAPMMMPGGVNYPMMMGTSSGVGMLQNLLNEQTGKNNKKQQVSQEQATMLYSIVRQTAEKVVTEYRRYRHNRNDFGRANTDLSELKAMVAQAQHASDASKQIEMEYTLRKAQRDVDKIVDEAKLHRQQLIDLAGGDAVARLDNQIEEETLALNRLVGGEGSPALTEELKADPQQIARPPAKEQEHPPM